MTESPLGLMLSEATEPLRSMAVSSTGGLGFRRNLGILSMAARGEILVALAAALRTAVVKASTSRLTRPLAVAVAVVSIGGRSCGEVTGRRRKRRKGRKTTTLYGCSWYMEKRREEKRGEEWQRVSQGMRERVEKKLDGEEEEEEEAAEKVRRNQKSEGQRS